jgi:CHAT domain-containing protein
MVMRSPGLLAGLALAGADRPTAAGRDDGILTAEEAQQLDLRTADLVVLSACETALGRPAAGEGLLGLQRAFQVAGARTLVASLWSVDDAATSVLMEGFYSNLWQEKRSKGEALRRAQLVIVRDPERVLQRRRDLEAGLAKSGRSRDLGFNGPQELSATTTEPDHRSPRSPPLWWAAFVLSGNSR